MTRYCLSLFVFFSRSRKEQCRYEFRTQFSIHCQTLTATVFTVSISAAANTKPRTHTCEVAELSSAGSIEGALVAVAADIAIAVAMVLALLTSNGNTTTGRSSLTQTFQFMLPDQVDVAERRSA